MIDIKDRKIDNGLRLITIKNKSSIMSVSLGVKCGGIDDSKKGISHFLEHMIFTGTVNRSHEKINNDLEEIGGESNAYTDTVSTVFTVSGLSSETENALDIISDIVINSVIDIEETERERKVILSEYAEGLEDLENNSFDQLYRNAFPEDPIRLNVIGDEDSINSIERDDLLNHYKKYYVPNNSVLLISSDMDHDKMENSAIKYFGKWQAQKDLSLRKITDINNREGVFEERKSSVDMATLSVLYTFHDLDEKYFLPLKILNNRFGSSNNSILFKEIRLKKGLAYDVYSEIDLTEHVRSFEIYCGCSEENIDEVEKIIFEKIRELKEGKYPFSDATLNIMKKIQRTQIAHLLDDVEGFASYVMNHALENKDLLTYQNDLKNIDKISINDLYEVASLIFNKPTVMHVYPEVKDDNKEMCN